jgi:hypothetical protein
MSYYEAYDIAHVQETYPRARLYLVHRLGTAIRNHRQVFRDLELAEAHRVRLDIKSLDSQSVDTLGAVPNERRTNQPELGLELSYLGLDYDGESQTSYAGTPTLNTWSGNPDRFLPQVEIQAHSGKLDEKLVYPLCFRGLVLESKRAWRYIPNLPTSSLK